MDINVNPTTCNQEKDTGTIQMDPQEHLTQDQEDPPNSNNQHFQFILLHYATPCGTCLEYHPIIC